MNLYHGTMESRLPAILKDGLAPRGRRRSNFKGKTASRPDMVYLSTAYPFWYSLCTKGKGRLAVVEVDPDELDPKLLYPDEDYIFQTLASLLGQDDDVTRRKTRDRLEGFQRHWLASIGNLGNCCYRGVIPAMAINRICLFDAGVRPHLRLRMEDPTISTLNFGLCGDEYAGLISWMFGNRPDLPEDAVSPPTPEEVELWARESKDRTGIEVLTPGELIAR